MNILVVVLCFVASTAENAVAPLSLSLEVGAKYSYKTVTTNGENTTTTQITYEVMSFKDGRFQIKETTDGYTTDRLFESFEGPLPDFTGRVVTFSLGKDRSMLDWNLVVAVNKSEGWIESANINKKAVESRGLQSLVFPESEVKIGTTWSQETLPPVFSSGGEPSKSEDKLTVEYKVIGFEDGGKVVVIEASMDDSYFISFVLGERTVELERAFVVEKKIWVEAATGMIVKYESETEMNQYSVFGESFSKSKMTIELTKRS